ncbi:MAG: NADH-quinone oxidoreductase subunit N [Candidatus Eisenbacteria bacterium]|nr:NADH-quinone oxidoreductase subunit N [Candidatus Eisenbacteria bacterium]
MNAALDLTLTVQDWVTLRPTEILTVVGLVAMLLSAFMRDERSGLVGWFAAAGMFVALADLVSQWGVRSEGFRRMIVTDDFTVFFGVVVLAAGIYTTLISIPYLKRNGLAHGEYYALIVFATLGAVLMASSTDLVLTFIGLETLSLAIYILAGFARSRMDSTEAALKYFLLGAFASAFLLFGIALLYGATGSTRLHAIAAAIAGNPSQPAILAVAMILVGIGFAFKVAAVPFHMWTPDVYEGAPASVTAYMAAGVKAAAFAGFARVFWVAFAPLTAEWSGFLAAAAILTMTWGNVVAIQQKNIKRMLAYSSIAHAGYLLVAMVAGGDDGRAALLFYFLPYALMNLGAFAVITALERQKGGDAVLIDDYSGLASRSPWLALAMAVFLFSLAGIPPTAGFMGKFYIFKAAVQTGHLGLAIVGVLNSVISVFYYLRPVVAMYMQEPGENHAVPAAKPVVNALMLASILALLYMGIQPGGLFDMALQSVQGLLQT